MIPGYNHNVKYGDRVYHVQTEDSGVDNPHIITHLFFGGNIIESRKQAYNDIAKSPNLKEQLVPLMQLQHKNMLKDLIRGAFDAKIVERSVNAATLNGPAPLNVEAGAQHRTSLGFGGAVRPTAPAAPKTPVPVPVEPPTPPHVEHSPASSFFGTAPPLAKVIEAATLEAAFDSKDDKAVDSIFGNLISEKSLDEVILSYLADDKTE